MKANKPVRIQDIVGGMDLMSDEVTSYLDIRTNKIGMISDDELYAAEENTPLENFPDWQREIIQLASEIINNEEFFIPLPSKYDIHEYEVMEKFCLSIEDPDLSESLSGLIVGRGAFRRFKDGIYKLDIADQWYEYREEAFREIARKWCEEKGINFVED